MATGETFYSFKAKNANGIDVSLADYKGRVVLVVNVASNCGFTPQYKELQELYTKYQEKGLVVLGFPCNQFNGQEPGTNQEIQTFCSEKYDVSFPILAKIDVNGDQTSPLYRWMKASKPGLLGLEAVKWNFTKFLIGKNGEVMRRYAPVTKPSSISLDIERALEGA